jgi:hypothetical protein
MNILAEKIGQIKEDYIKDINSDERCDNAPSYRRQEDK